MEQQELSLKPYAQNYGLIYGGYSILVLLLLYFFNYDQNTGISLLSFLINTAIVFIAIHRYKLDNANNLSLSSAIKLGLAIGAIGGLIYAIYMYIHYSYLQPEFIASPFFMATLALIFILLKTLFISLVVGLIKKN
ncbi:MAG: DUF4199 domain-containing protein [Psychroflexus halocasei]